MSLNLAGLKEAVLVVERKTSKSSGDSSGIS